MADYATTEEEMSSSQEQTPQRKRLLQAGSLEDGTPPKSTPQGGEPQEGQEMKETAQEAGQVSQPEGAPQEGTHEEAAPQQGSQHGEGDEEATMSRPMRKGRIDVTLLSLAGEVVENRMVRVGSTAGDLRRKLAKSLGFDVSLIDGPANLPDSQLFELRPGEVAPVERSLTCVLAAPRPSRHGMLLAIQKRQHGTVRAMLRAAAAPQRRRLLLLVDDSDRGDGATALLCAARLDTVSVLEVLVEQAEEAGVLEECLLANAVIDGTALHVAANKGKAAAMRLLLRAAGPLCGRLLLAADHDGVTALHGPFHNADSGPAVLLQKTELLLAAAEEQGVLRQLLLARGGGRGGTALHSAERHPKGSRALWAMVTAAKGAGLARELLAIRDEKGRSLAELAEEAEDEQKRNALASLAAAS